MSVGSLSASQMRNRFFARHVSRWNVNSRGIPKVAFSKLPESNSVAQKACIIAVIVMLHDASLHYGLGEDRITDRPDEMVSIRHVKCFDRSGWGGIGPIAN